MADAGFFKGTSADQDRRFSDKELKLLKSMKFPPEFEKKVDMKKVNMEIIRPWIAKKVTELVGFEDEVVIEYAMGLLEDPNHTTPDPKKMQINLMGFLTSSTPTFMKALWDLLLESQDSPGGVPISMVEAKKEELRKARESDQRAIDERDRRARLDEAVAAEATMVAEEEGITVIVVVSVVDFLVHLPHVVVHRLVLHSMPAALIPRLQSVGHPQDEIRLLPVIPGLDLLRMQADALVLEALLPISLVAVPPDHHHPPLAGVAAPPPSILVGHVRLPLQGPGADAHPATPGPHHDATCFPERIEQGTVGAPLHGDVDTHVLVHGHPVTLALLLGTRDSDSRSRTPPSRVDTKERSRFDVTRDRRNLRRSPTPVKMNVEKPEERGRTLDPDLPQNSRGELKIKGQASARKSKWDDKAMDEGTGSAGAGSQDVPVQDLEKRENELKEKALRNKVIRTRKVSGGTVAGSG
ncbi:hypothetical protein EDC04DRAFT_2990287 [Pisolithus marmoratus]|nr:hypothetical protein EDC04DRAFT_2990287 [Pisolithus marmoratus]